MKFLLLGAAIAGALMTSSHATNAAPVASWAGCYFGGSAGAVWTHADAITTTGSSGFFSIPPGVTATIPGGQPASIATTSGGGIAGVYGGCNYQMGMWVIGAEADWSALKADIQTTSTSSLNSSAGPIGFAANNWTQTQKNLVTARARFGYVPAWLPNTMLYATGGGAWTKVTTTLSQPTTAFSESQSDSLTGWVVGAGLEWMLPFEGWALRAEYLHVQFPSYTTFTSPITTAQPAVVNGYLTNLSAKVSDDIVRVGLHYRFWHWAAR